MPRFLLACLMVWATSATAQGALGNLAEETEVTEIGPEAFAAWKETLKTRATQRGISAATLDEALGAAEYLPQIIELDRNQAEFIKPIWVYLDTAVSDARVANGRAAMQERAELFAAIEEDFDVDASVVAAIWGLETSYGAFTGGTPVISALATLAADSRRGRFFEDQLVAALRILDAGDVDLPDMSGSWAGAMGHTQFMPTSYLAFAEDWDGDGRRDIWGDDPADALASTAGYLSRHGWVLGQPWGVEVTLPEGFDYRLADRDVTRMPSQWAAIGILGVDGEPVQDHGTASVLLPAGHEGAAFLVFDNFAVIERYNTADSYVVAVGHLSDRLRGGGPFRADWPRHQRGLSGDERMEIQRRLTALGFDTLGIDGKVGPNTVAAIRGFQDREGLVPDGYASEALLNRLRAAEG